MKKERRNDSFIKHPYFKGGDKALKEFIAAHLKYPASVLEGSVEGDVNLKYSIDQHGHVFDIRIIGGLDEACNAEAIRVVRLLKFVIPKNPKKLRITFHKNITIHFKRKNIKDQPKPVKMQVPQRFQYSFVSSTPGNATKKDVPAASSYNYTITIKTTPPNS